MKSRQLITLPQIKKVFLPTLLVGRLQLHFLQLLLLALKLPLQTQQVIGVQTILRLAETGKQSPMLLQTLLVIFLGLVFSLFMTVQHGLYTPKSVVMVVLLLH
jgi:hypothetical protein